MAEAVHDAQRLKELQALPLDRKIQITQTRIIEWYQHYNGQVCVSFSGGKDSTVLLHTARQIYPDIPAVFSNTGLEYSSIQRFVKSWDNVDIVVPKMRFDEVVSTYGYPLIGKEVAEAIYYARRLSSQNGHVEREREREAQKQPRGSATTTYRKRTEALGNRPLGNDWKLWGAEPSPPTELVGTLSTDERANRQRIAGVTRLSGNEQKSSRDIRESETPPG